MFGSSSSESKPRKLSTRALVAVILLICVMAGGLSRMMGDSSEQLLKQALLTEGDEKIKLLKRAVAVSKSESTTAHVELCIALARAKRNSELATTFSTLKADDCRPADLLSLATLCIRAWEWNIAESCLKTVSSMSHSPADRLLLECQVYSETGRVKEWIQSAKSLTDLVPDMTAGWQNLATAQDRRQNKTAAIAVYQAALTQNLPMADQSQMRHRLIEHCIETGDADLAREHWKILLQQSPSDPRLGVYDARLCHMEGRASDGLMSIDKVLARLGPIPEALRLRGILLLELGQLENAIQELTRVVQMMPNDEIVFFKLAEATRRLWQRDHDPNQLTLSESYQRQYQKLHDDNLRQLGLIVEPSSPSP